MSSRKAGSVMSAHPILDEDVPQHLARRVEPRFHGFSREAQECYPCPECLSAGNARSTNYRPVIGL